jgi:hypothetical protein
MDLDLRGVDGELRRQLDERGVGPQHGRQVDHLDLAGQQLPCDLGKKLLSVHRLLLDRRAAARPRWRLFCY